MLSIDLLSLPVPAPLFAVMGALDYTLIVIYLLAMVAIGLWFSGEQVSTREFFFASRGMSWFPLGMSLMATLISALTYTGLPAQSYSVGLKTLLMPLSVWLILPIMVYWVLPLYHGLRLTSVYEYLELRFDTTTRLWASLIFLIWRLLWLGGVIYAPCKVLLIASGLHWPTWPLILLLGAVTTLYTCLGGMKAVIWTDVVQGFAMIAGIGVIIVGAWWSLDGGAARVAEVAEGLGRTQLVELKFDWKSTWQIWGALPHWVLAMLSFYIADQITAQRFICASTLGAAQRSYVLNCVVLSILMPGLTYVGLCLLTFYYDHPEHLQPKWVTSLDNLPPHDTLKSADGSKRYLDWDNPQHALQANNATQLVEEGRIIRPNTREPFSSDKDFLDEETGKPVIEKLAMRKPNHPKLRGEVILHRRAGEELLPYFIANELPIGAAGLIIAALLAASMSSIDSGLNSICSLLVVDMHERFGWGANLLARLRGKQAKDLDDTDRLWIAQPLTVIVGVGATVAALLVAQLGQVFTVMIDVANTFGAPLLGIFLLGILTRRATSQGIRLGMIAGSIITIGMVFAGRFPEGVWFWPFTWRPNSIWTVSIGTTLTCLLGYLLSLVIGQSKSKAELRGLVVGLGRLGVRAIDEEIPLLDNQELARGTSPTSPPPDRSSPHRWS